MKNFFIKDLAKITDAKCSIPYKQFENQSFNGVSIDSRTIKTGDCFFAIPGDNFDGHDFIADAFEKGAACAVVDKNINNGKSSERCLLKVNDTIEALGWLAQQYRRQLNSKVVAITGSVGKTTTRQIAYHVLSKRFHVSQSPKNFNNNIGLPLTLLSSDPEDEIIIAEIGSNSPGEIACLTKIAQPDIAVVTNVHPSHLAGFDNLETILKEKLSIAEGLRNNGVLIINGDYDPLVDNCRTKGIEFISFGRSSRCDIKARNITFNHTGSRFTIDGKQMTLPLLGQGNVENALAAWSICSRFRIDIDYFANAIKTLSPVPMRTELLQLGTLTILNDCYNANPASMKNALDIIAQLGETKTTDSAEKRRRVFICADMAELGRQAADLHIQLATDIVKAKMQLILAVGRLAKTAASAAKKAAEHDLQVKCFKDTASACNNLERFIKNYDIILIKGSRKARLDLVVEKLKDLFQQNKIK